MTEAKHTPGPWKIGSDNNPLDHGKVIRSPNDEFIAGLGDGRPAADAHLIAAAPDMLEALKWTEKWIVKHGLDKAELIGGRFCEVPMLTTIRATIAKATEPQS